jgi:lysophospholipase L1-like esterase
MSEISSSIDKLKKSIPLKICAFGDSLTQGWMVQKGYLDFLNEMLLKKYPNSKFELINRGVPGNTAHDGLYRIQRDVIDNDPDLTFIQFALNDAYSGYSAEEFKANILKMVERIKYNTSSEILLLTSVTLNNLSDKKHVDNFYSKLQDIGLAKDIPVVEVHRYWEEKIANGVNFFGLVQGDLVHPTVEGYRLMAEAIIRHF